jgi:hypothetical protein
MAGAPQAGQGQQVRDHTRKPRRPGLLHAHWGTAQPPAPPRSLLPGPEPGSTSRSAPPPARPAPAAPGPKGVGPAHHAGSAPAAPPSRFPKTAGSRVRPAQSSCLSLLPPRSGPLPRSFAAFPASGPWPSPAGMSGQLSRLPASQRPAHPSPTPAKRWQQEHTRRFISTGGWAGK